MCMFGLVLIWSVFIEEQMWIIIEKMCKGHWIVVLLREKLT